MIFAADYGSVFIIFILLSIHVMNGHVLGVWLRLSCDKDFGDFCLGDMDICNA